MWIEPNGGVSVDREVREWVDNSQSISSLWRISTSQHQWRFSAVNGRKPLKVLDTSESIKMPLNWQ